MAESAVAREIRMSFMKHDGLRFENGHLAIVAAKHGYFLYNRNDQFIGRSLEHYGEWCEPGLDLILQGIRPGDTVLDIGANIGTHTVALAKKAGPAGRVIAFEPQRIVFQTLCANVALNGLTNVDCRRNGVGGASRPVRVPELDPAIPQNFGEFEISGHQEGEEVAIVTIDSLALGGCAMIKIDVEGMEREVILGGGATIREFRPMLFVENNSQERSEALIQSVLDLDYRVWWVISNYFRPNNYFDNAEEIFAPGQASVDMFCVPAEKDVNIAGLEPVRGASDNMYAAADRIIARNTRS